jgi:tRNA-2-methylthio-N6-dimethylallyladenosine synthase
MKFLIKNYGCQMNVNTADKIAAKMLARGFENTDKYDDADIIIFNTCCVRNTAEQKILSHIAKAKQLKKFIAVIGCLAEKDRNKFKDINIVLGPGDAESVVGRICDIFPVTERNNPAPAATQSTVKYIDITYGCENYCSYCIVPFVRGKLRMRPLDEIVAEFNGIKDSTKTIYLLGQNVNAYTDPKTGTTFPKLLERFAQTDGDFELNFLSSHPKDFDEELVKIIAANKKIMRDIHLPIQSGCDKILTAMNRKYTVAEYMKKIEMLRKYIPDVRITTDIICGFPTETEDDFQKTVETVKKIKFNAAYIFPYSNRSGTAADKMDGQVPFAVRKLRTAKLIEIFREMYYNMVI